jgi:dual specificity phosphatase 12
MEEIVENLWLGKKSDSISVMENRNGFKVVINVAKGLKIEEKILSQREKFYYFKIAMPDSKNQKYLDLQKSAYFLLKWSLDQNYKTLIHCIAGKSRSANIVILYLMIKNNWNYNFTFNFVKSKRKGIIRKNFESTTIKNFEILSSITH